jgi:hypothetical protein
MKDAANKSTKIRLSIKKASPPLHGPFYLHGSRNNQFFFPMSISEAIASNTQLLSSLAPNFGFASSLSNSFNDFELF